MPGLASLSSSYRPRLRCANRTDRPTGAHDRRELSEAISRSKGAITL